MALFRIGPNSENVNFVRGEGVYLRPPEMRDFEAWSSLRERSRAFLTPWEPTWPGDDLTRSRIPAPGAPPQQEIETSEAFPFLVFRDDDALVGGLTLGQIRRGVVQAATLGYWIGAPYAPERLHDASGARRHRIFVRHAAAAPHRGRLPAP